MKENKQGIGTKIKVWWQKSSLVSRFGIVIVIAAILILFVPRGIKGEKGNLLGLTPNRIEQKNKDQYSAEPINPDKHQVLNHRIASQQITMKGHILKIHRQQMGKHIPFKQEIIFIVLLLIMG